MKEATCLVLLSTYNGEKYIQEQLDSLLKQEGVQLHILIRDDDSKDFTVNAISNIQEHVDMPIKILKAKNLGAKTSFFELLRIAYNEYSNFEYFAFCDQDDVWKPNKLRRAVTLLSQEDSNIPLMYCSATQMVDTKLSPLKVWPSPPRKKLNMYNALVENVAVGCTTVLNKRAFDLIASSLPFNAGEVIMHDWWAYLCVSTFGKVIFDEEPFILYRQHSSNVLGGQTNNWLTKWIKRFRRYFQGQNHYIISNQAKAFFFHFHNKLDEDKRINLQNFIQINTKHGLVRFIYAIHTPFFRQTTADDFILKFIITTGKI